MSFLSRTNDDRPQIAFGFLKIDPDQDNTTLTYDDIMFTIPNAIVCLECFIFSCLFQWSWRGTQYKHMTDGKNQTSSNPRTRTFRAILSALNLSDIALGAAQAIRILLTGGFKGHQVPKVGRRGNNKSGRRGRDAGVGLEQLRPGRERAFSVSPSPDGGRVTHYGKTEQEQDGARAPLQAYNDNDVEQGQRGGAYGGGYGYGDATYLGVPAPDQLVTHQDHGSQVRHHSPGRARANSDTNTSSPQPHPRSMI